MVIYDLDGIITIIAILDIIYIIDIVTINGTVGTQCGTVTIGTVHSRSHANNSNDYFPLTIIML